MIALAEQPITGYRELTTEEINGIKDPFENEE